MADPLLGYLSDLRSSGKIAQKHHDVLTILARDLASKSARNESFSIQVPGNVSLSVSGRRATLEAVSKVSNTPELLEMILECLSRFELFCRANLVCKGFRNTIENSVSIQRELFRVADPNASPYFSFASRFDGLTIAYFGECPIHPKRPYHPASGYTFDFASMANSKWTRTKDNSLRKCFVAQPPFKHLIAVDYESGGPLLPSHHSEDWPRWRRDATELTVDTGITFGDLLSWFKRAERAGLGTEADPEENSDIDDAQKRLLLSFVFCDRPLDFESKGNELRR